MPQKFSQFNCMTLLKGSAKDSILYYYYYYYYINILLPFFIEIRNVSTCIALVRLRLVEIPSRIVDYILAHV